MAYTWVKTSEQPKIRWKGRWGNSGDVDTMGGASLPDGFVIVSTQRDGGNNEFRVWIYPALPTGEDMLHLPYNTFVTESAPNDGWGPKGRFDPTRATAVLHEIAANTYRLKIIFTSWRGDNSPWDLCLADTGYNLVRS